MQKMKIFYVNFFEQGYLNNRQRYYYETLYDYSLIHYIREVCLRFCNVGPSFYFMWFRK